MVTKALTSEQAARLSMFVQPYWHDEKQCAAEVAMSVIEEQKNEIANLRSQLETAKAESSFLQGQVSTLRKHLEQIKYVLGDQPTAAQVLDTMRMVHDNAKLTEFVGKAISETYERNVKPVGKHNPE